MTDTDLIAWAENLEAQADIYEAHSKTPIGRLLPWGLGVGRLRLDAQRLREKAGLFKMKEALE